MARRETDGRKGRRWSYTAGRHGNKVRVYERSNGQIYMAVWDPTARGGQGAEVKRSLEHGDRERAKDYADELVVQLRKGRGGQGRSGAWREEGGTVGRIFSLYRKHRSPDKNAESQTTDDRHIQLWTTVLGSDFGFNNLSRREWDRFLRRRKLGAIDSRGRLVPEKNRRPVGDRVVEKDCRFLRAVIRWATEYRDETGSLLLDRDPSRGLHVPRERNPERPVATHDRVEAIRAVYRDVPMRVHDGKDWRLAESHLPELFEIVVGTGRRISAVCALRVEDLDLHQTQMAPWGAIVWPQDTDKMARRWRCPISAPVREALESAILRRRRSGRVGVGPLFRSPRDPERSVGYYEAATWLRSAERRANLKTQLGGLWHPYRRLWASSRKDLPDVDVAQAGGWASPDALKHAYQMPDEATMLRVVSHEMELREVR